MHPQTDIRDQAKNIGTDNEKTAAPEGGGLEVSFRFFTLSGPNHFAKNAKYPEAPNERGKVKNQ